MLQETIGATEQLFTVSEVIEVKLYVEPTRTPVYDKNKTENKGGGFAN